MSPKPLLNLSYLVKASISSPFGPMYPAHFLHNKYPSYKPTQILTFHDITDILCCAPTPSSFLSEPFRQPLNQLAGVNRSSRRIVPAAAVTFCNVRQINTGHTFWQTACCRQGMVLGRVHIQPYCCCCCCCYHHHHHHHHCTITYRTVKYSRISMYVNSMFEISTFRGSRFTIIFRLPLDSDD